MMPTPAACDYFGVKLRHVPVDQTTFRADVAAIKAATNRNTIGIVVSAPCFPQGVIDPVEEAGAWAADNNIPMVRRRRTIIRRRRRRRSAHAHHRNGGCLHARAHHIATSMRACCLFPSVLGAAARRLLPGLVPGRLRGCCGLPHAPLRLPRAGEHLYWHWRTFLPAACPRRSFVAPLCCLPLMPPHLIHWHHHWRDHAAAAGRDVHLHGHAQVRLRAQGLLRRYVRAARPPPRAILCRARVDR